MNNEYKLRQMLVDQKKDVRFYYSRLGVNEHGRAEGGVVTVCIIRVKGTMETPGWLYTKGIAYCVPKDQFVKKLGRDIALGRAIRALTKREDDDYKIIPGFTKIPDRRYCLSQYDVGLSDYEKTLWGNG